MKIKWIVALAASPYIFYYLGIALNILVITANHGAMPVVENADFWRHWASLGIIVPPGTMTDQIHKIMVPADHFKFLGDWLQLVFRDSIASIGDCFQWLGEWLSPYAWGASIALLWDKHRDS
jgi:Family of unknown function (DUF5317)